MWHWTRKTWPFPPTQSSTNPWICLRIVNGTGKLYKQAENGRVKLCAMHVAIMWYKAHGGKKCQQITLFLLLLMSLCHRALGEYTIFLKHLPQLPLGFLPWFRLLLFHGVILWPKFSCAQSKDLWHYGSFVKKGPSSFTEFSINKKSCIMKYVSKGTFKDR